jgi:lysozyme family protein
MTTFEEIIEYVLEHEGGYVNDPTDRGGETNFGITKRFYPKVDIKNLTKEQAKKIYHQDYWRPAKCDDIPPRLRHIYFDMCVNFGRSGAVKVLQRAANAKGAGLIVDGKIGPKTINSLETVRNARIRSYRVLKFAKIVLEKPEQEKFWYGWYNRALEV